jgi:6-phosphogluconolactonase (cycloisomerase 2 family)
VAESVVQPSVKNVTLYVSSIAGEPHGTVVVFGGQPLKFLHTIGNTYQPEEIALNSLGELFVANYGLNSVTVYKPEGRLPLRTLTKGVVRPLALAVSHTNDVYVGSENTVSIFKNGRQNGFKRIHARTNSIAFDASNNAYIAVNGAINVYPPDGTQPVRTITETVDYPSALAVDASGNLYSGNFESNTCGNVTVYDAATGTLENTITDGICGASAFAFDSMGNVYVANRRGAVTVYAAGTDTLIETITKGVGNPIALAIDSSNNLYVANYANFGSISVYPLNHKSPSQVLTKDISYPRSLAWLP